MGRRQIYAVNLREAKREDLQAITRIDKAASHHPQSANPVME